MSRAIVAALAVLGLLGSSLTGLAQDPPKKGASLGVLVGPAGDGVTVREVIPGGPAAKAGVQNGDVITKADDLPLKAPQTLLAILESRNPGNKLKLELKHDGETKTVFATLAAHSSGPATRPGLRPTMKTAFLGVQVSEEASEKGALLANVVPDSPADKAGLRKGDLISRLDGQPINSGLDLIQAVRNAGVGKEVTLSAQREGKSLQLKARLQAAPSGLFPGGFPEGLPGGPGVFPRPPQLMEMPDQIRQLRQRIDELERRVRALEQQRGKAGVP